MKTKGEESVLYMGLLGCHSLHCMTLHSFQTFSWYLKYRVVQTEIMYLGSKFAKCLLSLVGNSVYNAHGVLIL